MNEEVILQGLANLQGKRPVAQPHASLPMAAPDRVPGPDADDDASPAHDDIPEAVREAYVAQLASMQAEIKALGQELAAMPEPPPPYDERALLLDYRGLAPKELRAAIKDNAEVIQHSGYLELRGPLSSAADAALFLLSEYPRLAEQFAGVRYAGELHSRERGLAFLHAHSSI
ncbi:hypothetical protein Dxin01_00095 [Deinococcus xinjiangensis]|uniref:Uncharacterized protein n=1 Tax=Deinococcus xinjiangensis TaxID=457454 RepID=A0ABP9V522_9DEIO